MTFLKGKKWLSQGPLDTRMVSISSGRLILIVAITGTIIANSYLYFQDQFEALSNPNLAKYYTDTIGESNQYFLTELTGGGDITSYYDNKRVIVLFGSNPLAQDNDVWEV